MNAQEFTTTSIALLGSALGWQTRIAERLGVSARSVRRWVEADQVPAGRAEQLLRMVGAITPPPGFERSRWIHGRDPDEREFLLHTHQPRFLARIVTLCYGVPIPEDADADLDHGPVYVIDGSDPSEEMVFCEILWFDQPQPEQIASLLDAAADAVDFFYTGMMV